MMGQAVTQCGLRGRVGLRNRPGESIEAVAMVGMEFLYLVRLGLRAATDPRIQDTLKIAEALLAVETPQGVSYRRYNEDGYGEHADGSPFDGSGIGRAWPLLTGERGHYELQLGRDPLPYLETMMRMSGPSGLLPEQVWDGPALPALGLEPGKPTGGAMPLVWAHAEFLKLLYAREQGRSLELLDAVEKHFGDGRPKNGTWHWRADAPFDILPEGRDFLVEAPTSFMLHFGLDGWQSIEDRLSTPLVFGRHGVRLSQDELRGRQMVDFTLYFIDETHWEGIDHRVRLPAV
jgi:glucoamylase